MKNKKLVLRTIFVIVITVLIIVLFISYKNHQNIKQILLSNYSSQQSLIEKNILSAIQQADIATQIIEKQLNEKMEDCSIKILKKYHENNYILNWDLDELKRQFIDYEIYIIDSNFVVVHTTYKKDLGLDFKKFSNFTGLLSQRLKGDDFAADRLDISINSSEFKKYSYIPTTDHKYLIELSIDIKHKYPILGQLEIASVVNNLTKQYSSIDKISIYRLDKKGSMIRTIKQSSPSGKPQIISEEIRLLAKNAISNNQVKVITSVDNSQKTMQTRKYIPYITYWETGELDWWNSYVIEFVYNDKDLKAALKKQQNNFLSSAFMVIWVFCGLTVYIIYLFYQTEKDREKLATVISTNSEGYCMLTLELEIMEVNDSLCEMIGYTREELIKRNFTFLIEKTTNNFFQTQCFLNTNTIHHKYELVLEAKGEHLVNVLMNATVVQDKFNNPKYIFAFIYNITERKQVEVQLTYLSLHDSLTGLYNRAYFEKEMLRLEEEKYTSVGIIVCDVDGLKIINDTLGHKKGDALLLAAANTIKSCFSEDSIIARIGGDEFAILLPDSNDTTVKSADLRIKNAIANYNSANPEFHLSISVGFAFNQDQSITMSDLFKEADNNMYREKLYHSKSTKKNIVQTLIKALEVRDFNTKGNVERLQSLVVDLALIMGLSEHSIPNLRLFAQFHDIGKVGIPDRILHKDGLLTLEEVTEMQRHCEIGYRIAQSSPELLPIADWILMHHEWWNGKGYPLGLKGEEIPLECRMLAIATTYDAMISNRPYRKPISYVETVAELKRCAGTQFDPYILEKFIQLLENQNTPVE